MTGRRGTIRKQLLNVLKETKGYKELEDEALDALCRELAVEEGVDLS